MKARAGGVWLLAALVASGAIVRADGGSAQAAPRLVVITAGDDMKFSVTSIAARRGETLKIRLIGTGTSPKAAMAHNVVVLRPGSNQIAFAEAAAQAKASDYIPAALKSQILVASILVGAGESTDIEITLPARAGVYPFLCTFPGHFANGARGTIEVK